MNEDRRRADARLDDSSRPLGGLPHAPEWDCPGADAIREARLDAHRRIIAAFRAEEERARVADKLRSLARADAAAELGRLAEILGSACKDGGSAGRLERFEALVTRCERLGVSRLLVMKSLHVSNVELTRFLKTRGFPPKYKPRKKN